MKRNKDFPFGAGLAATGLHDYGTLEEIMQKLVQNRIIEMCIPDGPGEQMPHSRRWTCWFKGHLRVVEVWEDGVLIETSIYF